VLAAPPNLSTAKANGAFYTPNDVARFLVSWAVRSKNDRVLDPSHGGGVFIRAAFDRVLELGAAAEINVFGIELDSNAHQATSESLKAIGFPIDNLQQGDFFEAARKGLGQFDAVVGNPPFIRYQRFAGTMRDRAIALMLRSPRRTAQRCRSSKRSRTEFPSFG